MIAALLLLAALTPAPPAALTIQTPRGVTRLPIVAGGAAGPVVSADLLVRALNGRLATREPWVEVTLSQQSFRFLLGAPILAFNDRLQPLAGWAARRQDSIFLPLQFVAELLPRYLGERYDFDVAGARLVETGPAAPPPVARLPNGLRPGHVITLDPGHGGRDPGNLGVYLPRGMNEKHVTLSVGLLLRDELRRRGIKVVMTRTTDTLISYLDRARYCTAECDLFVSLHVDALPSSARRRFATVRGFHTIIIGEANTEDADRIANMENEALRYEETPHQTVDDLDFILRNLQMNEYLRESARAAELVQEHLDQVHPGTNRGVKQHNRLAVLNTARRPAILVEMGFATNPDDARLLASRKSQESLASAIADAVVAYLLEYERRTGSGGGGGR